MLHGLDFRKIVLLSVLIFKYSNTSNSLLFQYQGFIL